MRRRETGGVKEVGLDQACGSRGTADRGFNRLHNTVALLGVMKTNLRSAVIGNQSILPRRKKECFMLCLSPYKCPNRWKQPKNALACLQFMVLSQLKTAGAQANLGLEGWKVQVASYYVKTRVFKRS